MKKKFLVGLDSCPECINRATCKRIIKSVYREGCKTFQSDSLFKDKLE